MTIKISSHFDAGAIEVVSAEHTHDIQLKLRCDTRNSCLPVAPSVGVAPDLKRHPVTSPAMQAEESYLQWFYFRLQGARGQLCHMRILNAGEATYPQGWVGYRAVASYDRENWFRVDSDYDGTVLTIHHAPEQDSVYYAYFEPYSYERHLALIGLSANSPLVRVEDLGNTIDGRDLTLLVVGESTPEKQKIWLVARQHPGETMAEWLVEGLLQALLDAANPVARQLLQHAVFYIVPNINPDGAARGNLRSNAAGANLNREWMAPSLITSPEVFYVRERMHQTGCDVFLDIHGDESLPYVFIAGSEMLPEFTPEQQQQQHQFVADFLAASPEFQSNIGYPSDKYSTDLLKLASKYVGHHFKCLSLTLEMPFKDNADMPDPLTGWNGERSARLGRDMLQPVLHHVLRQRALRQRA